MSAGERATEEIDARLMRYLQWVLYPLSACWGIHSLYHYHYKSWWSWLISSLADFAYTFGFVNMMPQIFINYKLKSVAHLPWRVFVYKVLIHCSTSPAFSPTPPPYTLFLAVSGILYGCRQCLMFGNL